MKLIDKDALVAEIKKKIMQYEFAFNNPSSTSYDAGLIAKGKYRKLLDILQYINTLEVKEVIAEQECTCNEPLNRIIGGSWNLLCPVNKLGLKNEDKVKVIIEAQKGE